jgi:hypothetical protein
MLRQTDQPETAAATQDEFEWVNAWAVQDVDASASEAAAARESNVVALRLVPQAPEPCTQTEALPSVNGLPAGADGLSQKAREYQVALDILAIMRARDALPGVVPSVPAERPWEAMLIKAHRTADSVPIILGSVMGLLMVIVFSAAAAFVKLAR